MKKIQLKTAIGLSFILLPFCATLISCSSDDDEEQGTEQSTNGRKLRQLTIADVPVTRATLKEDEDDNRKLSASWKAGDAATYINLTQLAGGLDELRFGNLYASESASATAFTGSVYCGNGDKLAFFYPAKGDDEIGSDGTYTIDLRGQLGTPEDLAQRFHYIYGECTVSVNDENSNLATGTISSMKSLLAVCKFTFTYHDTTNDKDIPISVKTLNIGYGNSDTGYPTTGSVTPSLTIGDVVASPIPQEQWKSMLTVSLETATSDGVYVALFPVGTKENKNDFYFSVTTGGDNPSTYIGTATAYLMAGKYYSVTLTLN